MALFNMCRCGKLVEKPARYCSACAQKYKTEKQQDIKHYDLYNRDQKAKAFYNSQAWRRLRSRLMDKYYMIDIYVYYTEHKVVEADTMHHIVELREDYNKGLEARNLIPLSESTHKMLHETLYKQDKARIQAQLTAYLRQFRAEYQIATW